MTQEQLAMMLGVSRQSVTKWESERSYPEMDKLLKLCRVFDCTLDELVQGDLTDREAAPSPGAVASPLADVFGYDEYMRRFANRISGGIMAIILGVAASIVFFGMGDPDAYSPAMLPENLATMLGLSCMFVGVGCGLLLIVPAGLSHSQFVRAHPYLEDFYTVEQKDQARSVFSRELVGGIMGIFLGICAVIFFADGPYEALLGVPLMLACGAVGVRFIVHGGMTLARVNIAQYNRDVGEVLEAEEIAQVSIPPEQKRKMLENHRTDKRIGSVCGSIMMVATIIALFMLFVPTIVGGGGHGYEPVAFFWLPWPIGGLLCGIVALLIKGFASDDQG